MSPGNSHRCPQKTEVYSRVVGYYRPVSEWNKGKRAEFADRQPFDLSKRRTGRRANQNGGK